MAYIAHIGRTVLRDPGKSLVRVMGALRKAVIPIPQNGSAISTALTAASRPTRGPKLSDRSRKAIRGLPVVFIHRSNSEHLRYALAQAQASNTNSTIFLIGDRTNDRYDFVEHHHLDDYFGGAADLGKIYKHFSTHGIDFELICFQRWFILRDFLVAQGIDQCLYLDSDVMLYTDVTSDARKFEEFDFTLCWDSIGCVFFLNRLRGLEQFCQFVLDIYSKKATYYYDRMVSHFAVRAKHGLAGGACDMTAFQFFREINFGQVGEASRIIAGSIYDPNINLPNPGFAMENGVKKIVWRDAQPFGTYLRTGAEVRFNSLHFNGAAKRLMGQYYTGVL
jgi:hypothetical protein